MTTANLIETRQATHGEPRENFAVIQRLKEVCRDAIYEPGNYAPRPIRDVQMEAIDMICVKLGRILSGDWRTIDHWADLCGYAEIAKRDCERMRDENWQEGPAPLQLRVGGRYVNRRGEVVEIVEHEPGEKLAWLDQEGWWYTASGKVDLGIDHYRDLIAEAPAPELPDGLPPLPDGAVLVDGSKIEGMHWCWRKTSHKNWRWSKWAFPSTVASAFDADSEVAKINGLGVRS